MDKVERYLDQVCRGIAGPRSLRQHIRRELAEHLRDAAAAHEAAGMSEQEAFARALEDFGGPEQVRAELEATHGHRMLTLVVDKALQWKEATMKARWIWSTWAHVALVVMLAMELAFIFGCVIFIVPKFNEMAMTGWIDSAAPGGAGAVNQWAISVLGAAEGACAQGLWIALVLVALWALFEWRVRSENKTLMRLAGLGTLAVKLGIAAFLTAAALILPLIIMAGPYNRVAAARVAAAQVVKLDDSMKSLDAAIAATNWDDITRQVLRMKAAIYEIEATGMGQPLSKDGSPEKGTATDKQLHAAIEALNRAKDASGARNVANLQDALRAFREAYGQLYPPAKLAPEK